LVYTSHRGQTILILCMPPLMACTRSSIVAVYFLISSGVNSSHTFFATSHRLSSEFPEPRISAMRVFKTCQRGSMGLRLGDFGGCGSFLMPSSDQACEVSLLVCPGAPYSTTSILCSLSLSISLTNSFKGPFNTWVMYFDLFKP
jgi:hypothetical protein